MTEYSAWVFIVSLFLWALMWGLGKSNEGTGYQMSCGFAGVGAVVMLSCVISGLILIVRFVTGTL